TVLALYHREWIAWELRELVLRERPPGGWIAEREAILRRALERATLAPASAGEALDQEEGSQGDGGDQHDCRDRSPCKLVRTPQLTCICFKSHVSPFRSLREPDLLDFSYSMAVLPFLRSASPSDPYLTWSSIFPNWGS